MKVYRMDNVILYNPEDFGTLCICAIRYCQGRRTYMPDLVRSIVRPHLKELSDKDLAVMINDCSYQKRFDLYGDEDIDKPGWIAWEKELLEELDRRSHLEAFEGRENERT